MWSITLKLMRKTKRMLIPAGIAIMIGTAFIASTFLFGNAMNDSLTRQMTAMFGNANYAVTVNSSDLSDEELNEAYSSTVGDFHLDQIADIEGVDGVRASVETGVSVSRGGQRHQRRDHLYRGTEEHASREYYGRGPAEGLQRSRTAGRHGETAERRHWRHCKPDLPI